ncbi:(deoxy)nucleoside triphosphate pyrophosphohydrolase [Oceanobacillus indicireducens]|uniref:8-oxo-dGTP diphosphatase n=1 Tax=Oceanobacillus indicireducens TaxID=1004261 RepID=A0A917Y5Q0_9BACI|nr:(deoxy)nucleoside triphosphate pyrophosphohydrolase [Oceanobacillus indicireducens]GGN66260.1 DNA mismatch repair protein MutT [Oceanobacillus indicireducens]
MIVVSAAIIASNNKILIAKRGKTKSPPNLWEFPGGKVEENESPEVCVVREIQEELKINIKVNRHYKTVRHTYEFGDIRLISFLAEYESGTIELTEHSDYKWVDIEELHHFEFAPADIPIVNKLLDEGIRDKTGTSSAL